MKEQPGYYSILTAEIRYSKEINFFEKVLYADITSLANKNGYCSATNGYFAEIFEKSKKTISRAISKFQKLGFLKVIFLKNETTNEIIERRLYLLTKVSIPIDENVHTPIDKNVHTPIDENVHTPIDENVQENNTRKNITRERKNIQKEKKEFSFTLTRKTEIENTSEEYQKKLKEYILKSNKPISFESFFNSCVMNDYKYKNFKLAFDEWNKKAEESSKFKNVLNISGTDYSQDEIGEF